MFIHIYGGMGQSSLGPESSNDSRVLFCFLLIFFILNIVQISVETDTLRIIYLHIYVLTKMFR